MRAILIILLTLTFSVANAAELMWSTEKDGSYSSLDGANLPSGQVWIQLEGVTGSVSSATVSFADGYCCQVSAYNEYKREFSFSEGDYSVVFSPRFDGTNGNGWGPDASQVDRANFSVSSEPVDPPSDPTGEYPPQGTDLNYLRVQLPENKVCHIYDPTFTFTKSSVRANGHVIVLDLLGGSVDLYKGDDIYIYSCSTECFNP